MYFLSVQANTFHSFIDIYSMYIELISACSKEVGMSIYKDIFIIKSIYSKIK